MSSKSSDTQKVKPPKYLVCVDGREESGTALRLACMKAQMRNGIVDMLHIVAPADFQTLGAVADKMREERKQEGKNLLKKLANEASATYDVTPRMLLREGATGDEIIEAANEDPDVTMLVIGVSQNNKRGTLSAYLAGQLGQNLFTPLLMVPGNLTDQQITSLV